MPDPNAAIGGAYVFTWRGFTARVPTNDYDEVRRFLRRRSKRDRLKVGVASPVRAEAARSTPCATAPPPSNSTTSWLLTSRSCTHPALA